MAGRIRDEDIALVRERTSIVDVDLRARHAQAGRRRQPQGPVPVPRREVAVVQRHPGPRRVLLLRLRGRRRRDHVRDGDRPPDLRRGGRAAGRQGRHPAAVRARPARPRSASRASGSGWSRRTPRRPRSTPSSSARPAPARPGSSSPQRGFDRAAAERYGCGFAPDGWDLLAKHLRQKGFTGSELVTAGLAREARSGQPDRPVPPPAAVADQGPVRRRDRVRRAQAVRRRRRPEVPQHPGDAALQEVPRALRHRPGQAGDRQAGPGGHRRGVHRRDGLPPGRRTDRGGDLRHGVRRRPHRGAAPAAAGRRRVCAARSSSPSTATRPGQKAALRAFEDDQRFVAQTFIAVGPDNMDPCELRLAKGDVAVRDLVARREPLLAFALRSVLARFDLDTAEGRVAALRASRAAGRQDQGPGAAPGVHPQAGRRPGHGAGAGAAGGGRRGPRRRRSRSRRRAPGGRHADSPQRTVEREALKLALQAPVLAGPMFDAVGREAYAHPVHAAVRRGDRRGRRRGGGHRRRGLDGAGPRRLRRPGRQGAGRRAGGGAAAASTASRTRGTSRSPWPGCSCRLGDTGGSRELKSKLQRLNPVSNADEHLRAVRRAGVARAARPRAARPGRRGAVRCSAWRRRRLPAGQRPPLEPRRAGRGLGRRTTGRRRRWWSTNLGAVAARAARAGWAGTRSTRPPGPGGSCAIVPAAGGRRAATGTRSWRTGRRSSYTLLDPGERARCRCGPG